MRSFAAIGAIALSMLCVTVQSAPASDIEGLIDGLGKCANAAVNGPPRKFIKIAGHQFHCYKIRVATKAEADVSARKHGADSSFYRGTMSHALRARPDDQIEYTIVLQGSGATCRLLLPDVKINRGGFLQIARSATAYLRFAKLATGEVEKAESAWKTVGKKLEGDWETTMQLAVLASVDKWSAFFPECTKQDW